MKKLNIINYRESFNARIFLTFSLFIIIATLAFTTFFFRYQSRSLTEKLESKGELLATLLIYNARLGVFTENADLLSAPVNGILEDPETLSVTVYTSAGKQLIMQARPGGNKAQPGDKWDNRTADAVRKSSQILHYAEDGNYAFWGRVALKPIVSEEESIYFNTDPKKNSEQTIGYVRVIMDGGHLRKNLHSLLLDSFIIGFVFLVIGAVIAYLLSGGIARPLNILTEGVKKFSDGMGYGEISVDSTDEIGNLASAFNEMVTSLKKRDEEKEELEEKLRHSQKMEAIGTLAGGVAHDFNNILMAIIGYGALLQIELPEGSKLWSYVDEIIKAGDRAANLTQRLLAFTRKQIITPQPVVLDKIVMNIEKLLTRLITEDVDITFRLEADNAVVMADAGQIDQVLINLVANARDAMPKGGEIRIATSVVNLEDDFARQNDLQSGGRFAQISVSDTGVGIPDEVRDRIFDPFFTTKEVGKGTGLGLSMVYGTIRQHNGIIEVESEIGQGTTFNIYLPLVEEATNDQPAVPILFHKGKKETILVAEDDVTVREFLKGLLEGSGYNVISVSNGEDAVKEFSYNSDIISLVLLDVIMPKKNGKEAYDEMVGIKPDIKAIFVSGYANDVIDWKCALQEEVYLIQKPVQPSLLLMKLREALDRN
ncbi:MAG TPA: ATP-binding protein [Geobacteraceae bacterium]|nr:ATP-binding protein [Geobacteraceae bacterium]